MKKVLVLEDESSIRSFIVINLRRAGYDVIEAESGEEALEKLQENPDTRVALLDIMLPGIDGFEVCRRIRATNLRIGIIMLTARSQEMDKVTGLMTGADDYVTKPFSPAELTARVRSLLRRYRVYQGADRAEPERERLVLGMDNKVTVNGRAIRLSYTEYEILHLFLKHRGQVLSIQDIYEAIWTEPYSYAANNIVMVHIFKIRHKIEADCKHPTILKTAWGKGYYID